MNIHKYRMVFCVWFRSKSNSAQKPFHRSWKFYVAVTFGSAHTVSFSIFYYLLPTLCIFNIVELVFCMWSRGSGFHISDISNIGFGFCFSGMEYNVPKRKREFLNIVLLSLWFRCECFVFIVLFSSLEIRLLKQFRNETSIWIYHSNFNSPNFLCLFFRSTTTV